METWIIALAGLLITVSSIIISRAVAIAIFKTNFDHLSKEFEDLKKEVKDIMPTVRSYLYLPGAQGGKPVYVTVADCENHKINCEAHICKKIDKFEISIKEYMILMSQKRDNDRKEINEMLNKISEFMGEVKHHIQNNGH